MIIIEIWKELNGIFRNIVVKSFILYVYVVGDRVVIIRKID